jgi:integrase
MAHLRKRILASGRTVFQVETSTRTRDGRREKKTRNFPTEREAKAFLVGEGAAIERHRVASGRMTIAAYIDHYLRTREEAGDAEVKTLVEYAHHLRRLMPHVGNLRLDRLTRTDMKKAYGALRQRGSKTGGPLHPRTVLHVHRIFHHAMEEAVADGLIAVNPVAAHGRHIGLAKVGKSPAKAPTAEELGRYVEVGRASPHWVFMLTAILTGARRGELVALRWCDIDFDGRLITVRRVMCEASGKFWIRHYPKDKDPRTFTISDELVEELRRLQLRQKEERLSFGKHYRTDLDLVFTRMGEGGAPWKPSDLGAEMRKLHRAAGLPASVTPIHGLRHANATLAIEEGVPVKVVAERLGHSTPRITQELYVHSTEALDRGAADALGRRIGRLLKPSA